MCIEPSAIPFWVFVTVLGAALVGATGYAVWAWGYYHWVMWRYRD